MPKKSKPRTLYRSAVNGQFVTEEYARNHPSTTVKEEVKAPPRK
ncbi:MAG TPA: multidrug transporter [Anaerolineae bacterium]|nr:multidrug transporter [Anaerolineae bacterium]